MSPNPLHNGGSPRYAKLPKHPDAAAQALSSRTRAGESSETGARQYVPYRPGAERRAAGGNSPLAGLGRNAQGTESTEHLIPRKPVRSATTGSDGFEEIPLQDMSAKKAGKRREHPVDPSLAGITASSSRTRGAGEAASAAAFPRSSMESTDEVGLPLPATAKGKGRKRPEGQTFREQVRQEEEAIIARNKKVGKVAGAVLGTVTAGAIGVVTWKTGPF